MEEVIQRIDQARRRIALRVWMERAAWCVFVGMCVALLAIALPKVFVLSQLPEGWDWRVWNAGWLGGGALGGLLAAIVWGFIRPISREVAAVEIDRRYGLRERVASSLLLDEAAQATEAGAALVRDAEKAVGRVEVAQQFGVSPSNRAWLPLAPALAAFLLITFVGNRTAESSTDPEAAQTAKEEVKKAIEKARKDMARRREEAEKKGLADASGLLKEIEKGTGDLVKQSESDRTKAIVKLNDLAKKLEKRKSELGGAEALRKQLNDMKDLGGGPAKKAANALAKGDYKAAMDEIAKLEKEIASGKITPERKQQLADQLGKMQQKLANAAQQHQQQMEELQKQINEAKRKGDINQAGKLQQKLDQMQQQTPQMQQLQQMAQKMGQAQQAMQNGDGAAGRRRDAADAATASADGPRRRVDGDARRRDDRHRDGQSGHGHAADAGRSGDGRAGARDGGASAEDGMPGMGMGEGRGAGPPRPTKRTPRISETLTSKQNVGRGASTFGGLVRGRSIKGEVAESIKEELSATNVTPADPLTSGAPASVSPRARGGLFPANSRGTLSLALVAGRVR